MRVPLFWLHEYCDPGIPLAELEHKLTMTGTKVEAVHGHGVTDLRLFYDNDLRFLEQFG